MLPRIIKKQSKAYEKLYMQRQEVFKNLAKMREERDRFAEKYINVCESEERLKEKNAELTTRLKNLRTGR